MGIQERRQREKVSRKNLILDNAEEILFTKGEDKLTMDAVAEAAEISKPTIYAYFKNKDELYVAIALKLLKIMLPIVKNEYQRKISGLEKIKAMIRVNYNFFKKEPQYANFYLNLSTAKLQSQALKGRSIIKDYYSELGVILEFFHKAIEEGKKDGSCSSEIDAAKTVLVIDTATFGILKFVANADSQDLLKEQFGINAENLVDYYLQFVERALK